MPPILSACISNFISGPSQMTSIWGVSLNLTAPHLCATRKSGTDSSYRIQCSCTGFYLLLQPACRPLSILAKVDTRQLPIPLSIAGWKGWLMCRLPVVDVTAPTPTYLSTGYCSGVTVGSLVWGANASPIKK